MSGRMRFTHRSKSGVSTREYDTRQHHGSARRKVSRVRKKHIVRYLAEFEWRFSNRFYLTSMIPTLGRAAVTAKPATYAWLKQADYGAQSGDGITTSRLTHSSFHPSNLGRDRIRKYMCVSIIYWLFTIRGHCHDINGPLRTIRTGEHADG